MFSFPTTGPKNGEGSSQVLSRKNFTPPPDTCGKHIIQAKLKPSVFWKITVILSLSSLFQLVCFMVPLQFHASWHADSEWAMIRKQRNGTSLSPWRILGIETQYHLRYFHAWEMNFSSSLVRYSEPVLYCTVIRQVIAPPDVYILFNTKETLKTSFVTVTARILDLGVLPGLWQTDLGESLSGQVE